MGAAVSALPRIIKSPAHHAAAISSFPAAQKGQFIPVRASLDMAAELENHGQNREVLYVAYNNVKVFFLLP